MESNKESETACSVPQTTIRKLMQPWLGIWHAFASCFGGDFVLTSQRELVWDWPLCLSGNKGSSGGETSAQQSPGKAARPGVLGEKVFIIF